MDQPAQIFLIGDSAEGAKMITAASKQLEIRCHLTRASNPHQAMTMLADRERFSRRNPDLIVIDFSASSDGFELLHGLKRNPIYRSIPMVMLAGPDDDARRAYDLHANAVARRPKTLESAVMALDAMCRLWLQVAERPSPAES